MEGAPTNTGAASADYTAYVLALHWHPVWALRACAGGEREDAAVVAAIEAPAGEWARTRLSLHGLWPAYANPKAHGDKLWPQYCVANGIAHNACLAQPWWPRCNPTTEALRQYNTSARWGRYANQYAVESTFSAAHQWSKHGSCTPAALAPVHGANYQLPFWGWSEAAMLNVSRGAGAALVAQTVGASVPYKTLHAAFSADVGGRKVQVMCAADSECALEEVWLAYAAEAGSLRPLVGAASALDVFAKSRGCTGCAAVRVLRWHGCPPAPPPPPSLPPAAADASLFLFVGSAAVCATACAACCCVAHLCAPAADESSLDDPLLSRRA